MEQYRVLKGVMEFGNHPKNETSLKRITNFGIFKFLFLFLMVFSGCCEKEVPRYIRLDTNALTFEYGEESQEIAVSSNGVWRIFGETDWCKVSSKTGSGDLTITVSVSENELLNDRKATLTFTCGAEITRVSVKQTPKYEDDNGEWVLINGVRWAISNVGIPGFFVSNPEEYGEYYQWNKGTTDFLFMDDYHNSDYSKSTSWLPTNDPTPPGYRLPTFVQIESLANETYVKYEWTTFNGVWGGKYTNIASGKWIFLPAAGYRDGGNDGKLSDVGTKGYYWSCTQNGSVDYAAYMQYFGSNYSFQTGCNKSYGLTIRPVAE